MKFKGYLEGLELADVIQILNMKSANSVIEVFGPDNQKGILYIKNGNIVYAETSNGSMGVKAAFEIFSWDSGTFREMLWVPPPMENIDIDTMFLLMEAARLRDEKRKHRTNKLISHDVKESDPLTNFLLRAESIQEVKRRALSLLVHNFSKHIVIAGITNVKQKSISFIINPGYKEQFWHIFRKTHPVIKISQENESKPLFLPFEKDIDAAIITKDLVTLIAILKNFHNDNKIFKLINRILNVITRVK